MAHLAPRAHDALAVEVQLRIRFARDRGPGLGVVADEIGHLGVRKAHRRAERPAGDGADVLFELAGEAGVFRPMPGIVDAWGELVRQQLAAQLFEEMPEAKRNALRREKEDSLRHQDRFYRLSSEAQRREVDDLICRDLAEKEVPRYERWRLRQLAEQAVLPFAGVTGADSPGTNVNA